VADVLHLLDQGTRNRHIGETRMNRESSRSHCVLTCTLRSESRRDGIATVLTSRLNLVDLAGSEQQKASGASGDRLREASNINKSLSILGRVINSLAQQQRTQRAQSAHVPYRDSKLTFLLQVRLTAM
jgi:kinesin family member 15